MINKLKDKEAFESLTKRGMIDEIRRYIEDQIALSNRKCINDEAFTLDWPYHQAKEMGLQKAYVKLLEFLPEIKND